MGTPVVERRHLTIAVVGLGKIGLPLAAQYASKGHNVIGCDVNPDVVADVNAGRNPIPDEVGLSERLATSAADGRLRATLDTPAAMSQADVAVTIVPLMIDGQACLDFSAVDAASASMARGLHPGMLVIYETTLPVGTTRRLGSLLEAGSGLRGGRDFGLAFSPERVYSGRVFEDLRRYPKVVGGLDLASSQCAAAFYRSVLDAEVVEVSNLETAEFTKLAETTYRDVNFALANQLARYASRHGVNTREAFEAANTQPYSHLHPPNIGIGGHCIPVYPHFLLHDGIEGEVELLRIARRTNDEMAETAVRLLSQELGGLMGQHILVLGLAYRENVKELAFSVGPRLVNILTAAGAQVLVHDPLFPASQLADLGGRPTELSAALGVDAVVIQAPHRAYDDLDWRSFHRLRVVLDGRGTLDPSRLGGTGAVYVSIDRPVLGPL
jgi:nucleotide sugar dehydrogenase